MRSTGSDISGVRAGCPRLGFSTPFGCGRRAQEKPAGAARWIAPSLPSDQGWSVGKPRSASAQSRAHDARGTKAVRAPFSLVAFSWASKRKPPARRDAGRTRTDASRFSRKRTRRGQRKLSAQAEIPNRRDAGRTGTDASRFSRKRTRSGQRKLSAPAEIPSGADAGRTRTDAIRLSRKRTNPNDPAITASAEIRTCAPNEFTPRPRARAHATARAARGVP